MIEISQLVEKQREYFFTGKTLSYQERINNLNKLQEAVEAHRNDIVLALKTDLNKSETEALLTEINLFGHELKFFKKHLKSFMRPKRVASTLASFPSRSYQVYEPYGVVLIMAPWNYPFLLCMQPLVGALASGNCVIIKPSAYAPNISQVIATIINETFNSEYCHVIQGGRNENTELLKQKFDFIFFTGSVDVGKLVMKQASENLTPVILELGGKSPCIVDDSADIELASKRLVFGKFINAGQTCVAPDYVLVDKTKEEALIEGLKRWINRSYGKVDGKIPDYPKIINQKHFERLSGLLNNQVIEIGGLTNPDTLQIDPTVISHVDFDNAIMQQEIFGPLLPIISYDKFAEVITYLHTQPKPLALYLFSNNKEHMDIIEQQVAFGGGCMNDTLLHLSNHNLPFGGVGNSGMGNYHGKASFLSFSHSKSILNKSVKFDIAARYRPYSKADNDLITKL